jgi:hypothetical protein
VISTHDIESVATFGLKTLLFFFDCKVVVFDCTVNADSQYFQKKNTGPFSLAQRLGGRVQKFSRAWTQATRH